MGNPRYQVQINNKIFETKTNAGLGYAITNYDNKKVVATYKKNNSTYKPKLYLVHVKNFYQSKEVQK